MIRLGACALAGALSLPTVARANDEPERATYTTEIALAYAVPVAFSATTLALRAPVVALAVGVPAILIAPPVTHWVEAGPARAAGSFVGIVLFGAAGLLTLALFADCPAQREDACLPEALAATVVGQSVWALLDIGDVALNPRIVRQDGRSTFSLAASLAF